MSGWPLTASDCTPRGDQSLDSKPWSPRSLSSSFSTSSYPLIYPSCLLFICFIFSQSQSIHHISLPKTIPTFLFLSRGMFHMKLCPLYPGLSFHNGTLPKYPNTAGWNKIIRVSSSKCTIVVAVTIWCHVPMENWFAEPEQKTQSTWHTTKPSSIKHSHMNSTQLWLCTWCLIISGI